MTLTLLAIVIGLLLVLFVGMRIGIAIALVALVCLVVLLSPAQPEVTGELVWNASKSYYLTSLPLFVFMAEVLLLGGVAERAYRAAVDWLGPIPGGAAHSTVIAAVGFAAMCGSSVASAGALGTMVGPQLVNNGYSKKLVFGTIAAGGTLGILIPPSLAMILYGALAGESIGHLFMAGVVPGIMIAALFSLTIVVWSVARPGDAPRMPPVGMKQKMWSLLALVPALAVIGSVLGGIYTGYFSPTESAGFGSILAVLIAAANRRLTGRNMLAAARSAVETTSMIMVIVAAAAMLTYTLGLLRVPGLLSEAIATSGLSTTAILIGIALLYIFLGCFIESISLVVLTIPILLPLLQALDVDLIWFGVYVVILVEIALLTPPLGLNLYVLQRVPAGQGLNDIIFGSVPFLLALGLGLVLLLVWPEIATWLPGRMK